MAEFKNLKEANEQIDLLEKEAKANDKKLAAAENKAEKLQAEVNNQATVLDQAEKKVIACTTENDNLKKVILDQDEKIAENLKQIETLESSVEELNELNNDMRRSQVVSNGKLRFLHKKSGQEVEINGKSFSLNSKVITAHDIIENEDLQDELMEMKAGFLTVIPEDEGE